MTSVYKHFDRIEVYEPNYPHIRMWVVMPRKAVYINRAADREAKIIRIGWDSDDDLLRLPFDD